MSVVALRSNHTAAQIDLIRRTVAKDCNDNEFDLFCTVVRNTGLDPFRKQIYAFVYSKDDAAKRKMAIVTGIDGMRAVAARSKRYRPDEEEPRFEYDADLKGPLNPLGLVKATVRIWMKDDGGLDWRPVAGVAYWDEFAPVVDEWAWNEQQHKRTPNGQQKLEGNWPKMGRVMLAKCAEAQAIRKAFPEDLSGIYETSEMDQANSRDDWTPSQLAEQHREEDRLRRIGGANAILFQLQPNVPLRHINVGEAADRIIEATRDFLAIDQLDWFESVNREALRDFWARSPGDALEAKKHLEAIRDRLAQSAA